MRGLRRRHFQHILAPGEVTAHELGPVQAEVIQDEGHRRLQLAQRQLGVFGDDVDLDDLVLVVQCQLGVVGLLELPSARFGVELDAHRGAKHRLATCEVQHLVGIEVKQCGAQRHIPLLDGEVRERDVRLQRHLKLTLFAGDQQCVALPAALERGNQGARESHAPFADDLDLMPVAQKLEAARVGRQRADCEESAVGRALAEGFGEGLEQSSQAIWAEVAAGVASQGVAQAPYVEHLPLSLIRIGRGLAQPGEQSVLDTRQFCQALRCVGIAIEGHADLGVVRQQFPAIELAQHVLNSARVLAGRQHQFVGRHARVVFGIDQNRQDLQVRRDVGVGAELLRQDRASLLCIRHQQAAGKHAGVVLVALEQARFLQPGHGDAHFGVGIAGVRVDPVLVGDLQQDLAGRDHHLALAAVLALDGAQRFQNRRDVVLGQPGVA